MTSRSDAERLVIVGLDLSLRSTGMVAIPSDWDQDFKRVERETYKPPEGESVTARTGLVATRVADFVRRTGATHVYREDCTYGPAIVKLNRLIGVVDERVLHWCALQTMEVVPYTARKLLLGSVPKGKGMAKLAVFEGLKSCGGQFTADEADAFAVANVGLSEQGLWCLSAPPTAAE